MTANTTDYEIQRRQERNEYRAQIRATILSLSESQRKPLDDYLELSRTSKSSREHIEGLYALHIDEFGPDSGGVWLSNRIDFDRRAADEKARAEESEARRKAEKDASVAERMALKKRLIAGAIERGEPIPKEFRTVRAGVERCLVCGRTLSDAESLRIGLGPECLRSERKRIAEIASETEEERAEKAKYRHY